MNCSSKFNVLAGVLIATLVAVGVAHGLWTDRWRPEIDESLEANFEKIPLTIGPWDGKDIDGKGQPLVDIGGGRNLRRYVNRNDGATVSVLLKRGPRGPMVIKHLPTECYVSAGYEIVEQPKRFLTLRKDAKGTDEFWTAVFRKTTDVVPYSVRVYWSWCGAGDWQAPDNPRLKFLPYRNLYKIYFTRTLVGEDERFDGSPTHEFIREFCDEFRKALFTQ